jgi:thiamine kinase-like enzyme
MEDLGEERIRGLPVWRGDIAIEPLVGGLSNKSWVVTDRGGRHVVRFGQDFPFHHVYREREFMTARAAHAAGFGPEVRYSEPGLMITAFLEARTFKAEDVRANIEQIAGMIRGFHTKMPAQVSGAGFLFWVFHVIRDYARTLKQHRKRLGFLPTYLSLADEMESAQIALPIVFGHHDLLPANFLGDGKRIWLIDFEYAGFGTPLFDLANLASNANLSKDEADRLLTAYFGGSPSPELRRAFDAMQVASLLREAMWSMVSELYLETPGVNYAAYANENLRKLGQALEAYRSQYGTNK